MTNRFNIALIIAAVSLTSLSGCGDEDTTDVQTPTNVGSGGNGGGGGSTASGTGGGGGGETAQCEALPTCSEAERQVDACGDDTTCHEVELCGSTVYCETSSGSGGSAADGG